MMTLDNQTLQQLMLNNSTSEIIFENIEYIRHKVISKKYKEKAITLAQESEFNNFKTILVEHKLFFSIWLEKAKLLAQNNLICKNVEEQTMIEDKIVSTNRIHPKIQGEQLMIEDKNELDTILNQKFAELGL